MEAEKLRWAHAQTALEGAEYFIADSELPYVTAELPGIGGRIKAEPSHFQVTELDGIKADRVHDKGCCHIFLTITRESLNTADVQAMLAKMMGLTDAREVGVCGLKDKHARCTQTFSIPSRWRNKENPELSRYLTAEEVQAMVEERFGDQLSVVKATFHSAKLRRNDHAGNRFRVVVSDLSVSTEEAMRRCRAILSSLEAVGGWPNYYGCQRFGKGTATALKGLRLLKNLQDGPGGAQRKRLKLGIVKSQAKMFSVSAFSSLNFNVWLANRIRDAKFGVLLEGDLVTAWSCLDAREDDGGGSHQNGGAPVEEGEREGEGEGERERERKAKRKRGADRPPLLALERVGGRETEGSGPSYTARFKESAITYTGPMFGYKYPRPAAGTAALKLEETVQDLSGIRDSTYRMLNVAGARRPALIPIRGNGIDFTVAECKEGLAFSFQLPPGCYATSALREFVKAELQLEAAESDHEEQAEHEEGAKEEEEGEKEEEEGEKEEEEGEKEEEEGEKEEEEGEKEEEEGEKEEEKGEKEETEEERGGEEEEEEEEA